MKITFPEMPKEYAQLIIDGFNNSGVKTAMDARGELRANGEITYIVTANIQDYDSSSFTKEERVWLSIYRTGMRLEESPYLCSDSASQAVSAFRKAFPI